MNECTKIDDGSGKHGSLSFVTGAIGANLAMHCARHNWFEVSFGFEFRRARGSVSVTSVENEHHDSGTLKPILKPIETAGLVVHERGGADERRVLVRMSPVALRMRQKLASLQAEFACGTGLSPREFTALRDTLHRMARPNSTRHSERGSRAA